MQHIAARTAPIAPVVMRVRSRMAVLDHHGPIRASCSRYRIKGYFMRTITSSRAENLLIGELSKRSGVNIETIRYYERVNILVPPPRTGSGRRVYDSTALRILVFVRRSRELGFSLDEIRALLRLGG